MEMRIVAPQAAGTTLLAERLAATFGPERILHLADRREVDVRIEGESDHAVLRVLDAVERWLDDTAVGSAEMWLGENSYRVAPSVPPATWQ